MRRHTKKELEKYYKTFPWFAKPTHFSGDVSYNDERLEAMEAESPFLKVTVPIAKNLERPDIYSWLGKEIFPNRDVWDAAETNGNWKLTKIILYSKHAGSWTGFPLEKEYKEYLLANEHTGIQKLQDEGLVRFADICDGAVDFLAPTEDFIPYTKSRIAEHLQRTKDASLLGRLQRAEKAIVEYFKQLVA